MQQHFSIAEDKMPHHFGVIEMNSIFKSIIETPIPGCYLISPWVRSDNRGEFVKTFHARAFQGLGLEVEFREHFYSTSYKNVLRGMHFHRPPYDHAKLVYCVSGKIFDGIVDLRCTSPTYKQHATFELSAENAQILYLSAGIAHGFYTLSDQAITVYSVSGEYSADHDAGIRWDSCAISWPNDAPIVSERDAALVSLADLVSVF